MLETRILLEKYREMFAGMSSMLGYHDASNSFDFMSQTTALY